MPILHKLYLFIDQNQSFFHLIKDENMMKYRWINFTTILFLRSQAAHQANGLFLAPIFFCAEPFFRPGFVRVEIRRV